MNEIDDANQLDDIALGSIGEEIASTFTTRRNLSLRKENRCHLLGAVIQRRASCVGPLWWLVGQPTHGHRSLSHKVIDSASPRPSGTISVLSVHSGL